MAIYKFKNYEKLQFSWNRLLCSRGLTWIKISKKYNLWILDNCYRIFYSDTTNSITHSKKLIILWSIKSRIFLKKDLGNISCLNLKLINFYRFKFINNFYFKYKLKNKIKLKRSCIILASLFGFILFVKI